MPSPNDTAVGTACLYASSSWWEGSKSFRSLHPYYSSYVVTTSIGNRISASTHKYCDGVPRVTGTEAITIHETITLPPAQWFTTSEGHSEMFVEYLVPSPSCSVDALDCKVALESWSRMADQWVSSNDYDYLDEYYSPGCSTTSTSPADASCFLLAKGPHLIYWPSTLVQSSTYSCDNGTIFKDTVTPTDTEMVTVVLNDTTYTSPTLYVSFDKIWNQYEYVAGLSSTTKYNVVIAMDSKTLSSIRLVSESFTTHSFNFLDLTGPVPLAAYKNQFGCDLFIHDGRECRTVLDDYFPHIIGPQEMNNADPAFASCKVFPIPMRDPPISLQHQDGLIDTATITPTGKPTTEPASPSKITQLNLASKTADPPTRGDPPIQASSQTSLRPVDIVYSDPPQNLPSSVTSLPSRTSASPTSVSEKFDPRSTSALKINAQHDSYSTNDVQQNPVSVLSIDNTPVSLGHSSLIIGGKIGSTDIVPTHTQQHTITEAIVFAISSRSPNLATIPSFSGTKAATMINGQILSMATSNTALTDSSISHNSIPTTVPQGLVSDKSPINQHTTNFSQASEKQMPNSETIALIKSASGPSEGANAITVTDSTAPTSRSSRTNSQNSERLSSSARIGALIVSAFGRIGEEASRETVTGTSFPTIGSSIMKASSIVTNGSSTAVAHQTSIATGALVTSNKQPKATGNVKSSWWMLLLLCVGRLVV